MLHGRLFEQVGPITSRCGLRGENPIVFDIVGVAVPDNLLPAKDLEMHQVQMYRVRVTGHIPDLPLLGLSQCRVLGNRAVPGNRSIHLADKTDCRVFSAYPAN